MRKEEAICMQKRKANKKVTNMCIKENAKLMMSAEIYSDIRLRKEKQNFEQILSMHLITYKKKNIRLSKKKKAEI